jgi:hypothetical protein
MAMKHLVSDHSEQEMHQIITYMDFTTGFVLLGCAVHLLSVGLSNSGNHEKMVTQSAPLQDWTSTIPQCHLLCSEM